MTEWEEFVEGLEKIIEKNTGRELQRKFLNHFNDFFYVSEDGLGETEELGDEVEYFSKFHKIWKENYKDIINLEISSAKAKEIAEKLLEVQREEGLLPVESGEKSPPSNLSVREIAKVRFFSANQDFKIDIESPYEIYNTRPELFDKDKLSENQSLQNDLIRALGAESQYDKRTDYVKNSAKFLNERDIDAYGLAEYYDRDVSQLREALIDADNMGYSEKKTDMFIRDMYDLEVWDDLDNLFKIDVASDRNTIKIALRTGLLDPSLPPLSSFLDVYCYQYGLYDQMNAKAWRKVWEEMRRMEKENAPLYPGALDFLIYNLGRTVCKSKVTQYKCDNCGTNFKWNSRRKKKCPECSEKELEIVDTYLPCEIGGFDDKNVSRIEKKVPLDETNCIFHLICEEDTKILNPPNSISIRGRTGWESAKTDEGGGGGLTS